MTAGSAGGSRGIFGVTESRAKLHAKSKKFDVKFKDVAGIDEVKEEIMEFVKFLNDPSKYEALGATMPRGALLSGPPGTGKTLLAKATAGEAKVPFFFVSGSEFIEMFAGVGASRVRDLFENAKKSAPCIIFIDEIDAVGKARGRGSFGPGGVDERESTLNQLLVEMDGFTSRDHIVVFAGTNMPDLLDPALLRPGRFDRHIQIDLPSAKGRMEIFKVHMTPLKTALDKSESLSLLASMTPGFSGADIKNVCNEAAIIAVREDAKAIEEKHFKLAVDRVVAGTEKKSMFLSKEERNIVAYHEAGHAVVAWFLEHSNPILKISIIPRSSGALGFTHFLSEETYLKNPLQLMDLICTLLGGRAAEQVFFNKVTTGASDDIKRVTKIAYAQIQLYGMSSILGNVFFGPDNGPEATFYKPYSEETSRIIDEEVKKMVNFAYDRTLKLINSKRSLIKKVVELLLKNDVVEANELKDILGPRTWANDPRIVESTSIETTQLEPKVDQENDEKEAAAVVSESTK